MCMVDVKKVLKVDGNSARLEDGRMVRLGGLEHIRPGQYLEVYADIALAKVNITDVNLIEKSRKEHNVS